MGYDFEYQVEEFFLNEFEPFAEKMLIGLGIFTVAAILIALASWIMRSIALTHLGNRRGVKAPWLVWLPIVGPWTIGALADDYDARNGIKRHWRVVLLVCSILVAALYSSSYGSAFGEVSELAYEAEYGMFSDTMEDVLKAIILLYAGLVGSAIISMVQYACTYICLFKVYESTLPRWAVLCFILSIFVPLAEPICLLIAMNKGYPDKAPALPSAAEAAPEARGWYEV